MTSPRFVSLYKLILAQILVISILTSSHGPAVASDLIVSNQAPVAFDGHNGNISAEQLLQQPSSWDPEQKNRYSLDAYPVKVCSRNFCEIIPASYEVYALDPVSRTLSRRVTLSVMERFNRQAVSLSFPIDESNLSMGWTPPSNEVTGWVDLVGLNKTVANDKAIEFSIRGINSFSISEVRACFNRVEDVPFVNNSTPLSLSPDELYLDLTGYDSATYELIEDGVLVQSGRIKDAEYVSSPFPPFYSGPNDWRRWGGRMCGTGNFWSFEPMNFSGLKSGAAYEIRYFVNGSGKPQLSGKVQVVTPGGCPTSPLSPNPFTKDNIASMRPNSIAYINSEGEFLGLLPTDTHDWRAQSAFSANRIAPVINSQITSPPYFGNITAEKIKTEKWQYIRETNDWALVTDGDSGITAIRTLRGTVFANCTSDQISITAQPISLTAQEITCKIVYDQIVPTAPGICYVRVIVKRKGVSASSVLKNSAATTINVPYKFTSTSKFAPRPPNAITLKTSKSRRIKRQTIVRITKINAKKISSYTVVTSRKYSRLCRVVKNEVQTLKRIGTCVVNVRIKLKNKTLISRTLWIDIRK